MMNIYEISGSIAGGIEVTSNTISCGGQERVVGGKTNWNMRNKFLQLKHMSDCQDEKRILKILHLKLPLTFDKKMVHYDDDKKKMHVKSKKKYRQIHTLKQYKS